MFVEVLRQNVALNGWYSLFLELRCRCVDKQPDCDRSDSATMKLLYSGQTLHHHIED